MKRQAASATAGGKHGIAHQETTVNAKFGHFVKVAEEATSQTMGRLLPTCIGSRNEPPCKYPALFQESPYVLGINGEALKVVISIEVHYLSLRV